MELSLFSSGKNAIFVGQLYRLTGIKPKRLAIYREAMRHSSVNDLEQNTGPNVKDNERLEFLGDAILDAVVAEYLFMRYPQQQEGFLTEMRTRLVNREQLADLSEKLGLAALMEIKPELMKNPVALKTISSNALESLIGAIYLDRGYKSCQKFIVQRLIGQYLDMDKLMNTTISFKATLLKWAQRQKKVVSWEHSVEENGHGDVHVINLLLDGEVFMTDRNRSRKKAEELCCEKACRMIGIS